MLAAQALPGAAGPEDLRADGAPPATVEADTPQEEVARLVSKYDVHAIPVVDDENRLLGIVTVDDVIDVLIEEQTEDILHLGGVLGHGGEVEQGYFASKPLRNVRLRFNWLLLLFVAETFTGTVLRHFESELAKVVALSFFIPLLIGTGRQLRLADRHDDRARARRRATSGCATSAGSSSARPAAASCSASCSASSASAGRCSGARPCRWR